MMLKLANTNMHMWDNSNCVRGWEKIFFVISEITTFIQNNFRNTCYLWYTTVIKTLRLFADVLIFSTCKYCTLSLTLKRLGGGPKRPPPSTFLAIISPNFFPAHRALVTFFFQVLRNFWHYFWKNWTYRLRVTQHYVIECRLKIWAFSGFVYKTYGKGLSS